MKTPSILSCVLFCVAMFAGGAPAQEDSTSAVADDVLRAERLDIILGAGELREPLGLAVDDRGFVLVADAMAGKVYRYSQDGVSLAFEAPALDAGFYPIDVAAQGTRVYVLDYAGNRILRYEYKGAYLDVLLDFSLFPRMKPVSLTSSTGGRLLTTDLENHNITVWSPLLDIEISTGEYGWADGSFEKPVKAALFGDEKIAVAEFGNSRVQILGGSGGFEGYAVLSGGAEMGSPRYVCGGLDGYLFVADPGTGLVYGFSPSLDHVLTIGGGEDIRPSAVAASWDYRLYIADLKTRSILVYRLDYPGK
ncbi:MAG: NHL repeat-containing protein [Candidatus Krumholzibacteria bacterium]|nr:NHL repeat-containing protein [Candidatus Krumholzibacteria bacterium]